MVVIHVFLCVSQLLVFTLTVTKFYLDLHCYILHFKGIKCLFPFLTNSFRFFLLIFLIQKKKFFFSPSLFELKKPRDAFLFIHVNIRYLFGIAFVLRDYKKEKAKDNREHRMIHTR